MRVPGLVVLAVLAGLVGCDRVLDVREFRPTDAGATIPFDAAHCRATTANVIVDTYLADDLVHGTADALLISAEHPGLLHFQSGLVAGEVIAGAIVTLHPVATAMECGATCGACNNPSTPTGWHVSWNTNNWDEQVATATIRRAPAVPWGLPFAGQDTIDRSLEVERGTTRAGDPIQLVLDPQNVAQTSPATWLDQGKLTIQVRFDTQIAISSREITPCPDHPIPTMSFVLCQSP